MLGKILQLLGKPLQDGFEIVNGVNFCEFGTADLRFAKLSLGHNPVKSDYNTTYCWQFTIEKEYDGFKDIMVNNCGLVGVELEEKVVEEKLWVIIPYSGAIETTAKKIAGRTQNEAILEMYHGDTVKVNKAGALPETYMAVQAGNELLLVKKNR